MMFSSLGVRFSSAAPASRAYLTAVIRDGTMKAGTRGAVSADAPLTREDVARAYLQAVIEQESARRANADGWSLENIQLDQGGSVAQDGLQDDASGANLNGISSGQSKLNKLKTKGIVDEAIKLEKPIFADDLFGKYVKKVKKIDGVYDVASHGTPKIIEYFGTRIDDGTLAKILNGRSDYNGKPIRLLSCNVGKEIDGEICFAQRLANRLNKEILAPTDTLWVYENGETTIGPDPYLNTGKWKYFRPQKEKTK